MPGTISATIPGTFVRQSKNLYYGTERFFSFGLVCFGFFYLILNSELALSFGFETERHFRLDNTNCRQNIMNEKCGHSMINGFEIKLIVPLKLFSNPGGPFRIDLPANQHTQSCPI